MASSGVPGGSSESSYETKPSPSSRRTQWTFSNQRAEFTKPVPAALLPVYAKFPTSSHSDDEGLKVNMMTETTTLQGRKTRPSTVERNCQVHEEGDTIATAPQFTVVHGSAEESGISLPKSTNSPQKTAGLDRSPSRLDEAQVKRDGKSNFVMAKLAYFLGLEKKQEQDLRKSISSPLIQMPLPTPTNESKYTPVPSPSRGDHSKPPLEDCRDPNISVVIEDEYELACYSPGQVNVPSKQGQGSLYTFMTYPPPVQPKPLRHRRSRSLDVGRPARVSRAPARSVPASLIAFAQEDLPPGSRSRSLDDPSRREQTIRLDGNVRFSSVFAPPVNLPPNCVLVQVWAAGLDERDRQLIVGSDDCMLDKVEQTREATHQARKVCKEGRQEAINHSIFNRSRLLGWSLDFGAKKKEKEPTTGWLNMPSIKPLSTLDRQTRKDGGIPVVRDVSGPEFVIRRQEAGYIPGRSFVGRVWKAGSSVDKTMVARDDWVIGLVDSRKCGCLAEFIVIDWRQVHHVPAPYERCQVADHKNSTSTLVLEPPDSKPTQDVVCNQGTPKIDEAKHPLLHFPSLTFNELALLPLCGIPAYRSVKACVDAFPTEQGGFDEDCGGKYMDEWPHPTRHRRALVLRGHDGVGAMAVQMLVRRGWLVSAHVPFSRVPWDAIQAEGDAFMFAIEDRLKKWGVDEVIYDDASSYASWDREMDDRKAAVVKVIETLRTDGDVFDAVLDFVGGREIREAGERLLRVNGGSGYGVGQFMSLVSDTQDESTSTHTGSKLSSPSSLTLHEQIEDTQSGDMGRRVKYTQLRDVFESGDEELWELLGAVFRLALEDGVRPHVEEVGGEIFGRRRVMTVENAANILEDDDLLSDGGMAVVRVVD